MVTNPERMPRPYLRGTSSVVSFEVAMNGVDDVDLVDVDLAVSICDRPRSVLFVLVVPTCFVWVWPCWEQNNT